MLTATANATRRQPARKKPRAVPFTFQCTSCETVEHRPTPMLPKGWITIEVGADILAYCDCCADNPTEEEAEAIERRLKAVGAQISRIGTAVLLIPGLAIGVFLVGDHVTRWALRT